MRCCLLRGRKFWTFVVRDVTYRRNIPATGPIIGADVEEKQLLFFKVMDVASLIPQLSIGLSINIQRSDGKQVCVLLRT